MKNKYYCVQCGKELNKKNPKMLCKKHLNEYNEYGFCISTNSHDKYTPNEILINEDYAEIVLYDDITQEELNDKILIDLDDVETVKGIIWKKVGKHIVGVAKSHNYDLPNLIMDTNAKIEYIDGNRYNNRKSNLNVIEKKKFKHHFANNKKYKNKIIITSLGGSTEDVTGSCFAVEYPLDNGNRDLVLIELGSIQTNRIQEDYISNKKVIEGIPFNLASNIFICHTHVDHIGNLPSGITRGFNR